jgi:hypothetical protein
MVRGSSQGHDNRKRGGAGIRIAYIKNEAAEASKDSRAARERAQQAAPLRKQKETRNDIVRRAK